MNLAMDELHKGNYAAGIKILEGLDGNKEARITLARLYATGEGVVANPKRAKQLLMCQGDVSCVPGESEFYLGIDFYDGTGMPKREPKAALYWINISASYGYPKAAAWLRMHKGES